MISFQETLTFTPDMDPSVELLNFWPAETDFVWSTGRWCEIHFDFADTARRVERSDLILDIDAFKSEGSTALVALYLNGSRIGTAQIGGRMTLVVNFATSILQPTGNNLTIDTPDVLSPEAFGEKDNRLLGVQLFSAQIRKC